MKDYQEATGYKPAFQLDLDDKEELEHSDYVLEALYGELEYAKAKKGKEKVAEALQKDSLISN